MAETKPSPAPRPNHGVRRSTTHSGVTHVRTYQSGHYTVVGNHLAQHRELSLTAIGLATHILSLPEGAPVDIRSLADRFPEGRDRIAFALRELEAYGYLERVRERTESGRLFTRTYAHHTPAGAATPRVAARVSSRPPLPTARTAGGPVAAAEAREASQEDDQASVTSDPPACREGAPAPPKATGPESSPRDRQHDRAVTLLAGLRRTDERLTLSQRQLDRLAPAVVAWFAGGASDAVVHRALTVDLPDIMRHPAGVLAHRLGELLPAPLPPSPPAARANSEGALRRPDPFQTCDGCERAFRAPEPGRCRDCRAGCGTVASAGLLRVG